MVAVQISFQGIDVSDALRDNIMQHVQKLETFAPEIISCDAVVKRAESRHQKGNRFLVHLRVTLPGAELNAGHATRLNQAHEDPFVAARDSFHAMRRRLEEHERRRRGNVKRHAAPPMARILSIDPGTGSGVLITPDEREIRFHRNSVVDFDFERLAIGDKVRFAEVAGEDGPVASTVHVARRGTRRAT